ncbi:MAG: Dabb family protein [Anaerolineales bacterium]
MLNHIVMFKFPQRDPHTAQTLKDKLMTLPDQINEIRHYEVGINMVAGDSAYDVVLISRFDSLETLHAYQIHPAHMAVLDYIREVTNHIVKVDFEA